MISVDPFPETAQSARIVIDYIHNTLLESPLGSSAQGLIDDIVRASLKSFNLKLQSEPASIEKSRPESPGVSATREGYFTSSLRRSASIAASLKNLALGYSNPNTQRTAEPVSPKPSRFATDKDPDWNRPPDVNDYTNTTTNYHSAKEPVSKNFHPRDPNDPITISIPSKFMDWSIEVLFCTLMTAYS
jgi:regulator-associated protein of mTOR